MHTYTTSACIFLSRLHLSYFIYRIYFRLFLAHITSKSATTPTVTKPSERMKSTRCRFRSDNAPQGRNEYDFRVDGVRGRRRAHDRCKQGLCVWFLYACRLTVHTRGKSSSIYYTIIETLESRPSFALVTTMSVPSLPL